MNSVAHYSSLSVLIGIFALRVVVWNATQKISSHKKHKKQFTIKYFIVHNLQFNYKDKIVNPLNYNFCMGTL